MEADLADWYAWLLIGPSIAAAAVLFGGVYAALRVADRPVTDDDDHSDYGVG